MNTKQESRILDPMALWGVEMSKPEMWALIEAAYDLQEALKQAQPLLMAHYQATTEGAATYRLAQATIASKDKIVETPHNPNRWLIVNKPDTDDEDIVIDFASLATAIKWISNHKVDWPDVEIMRRLDNGVLTKY